MAQASVRLLSTRSNIGSDSAEVIARNMSKMNEAALRRNTALEGKLRLAQEQNNQKEIQKIKAQQDKEKARQARAMAKAQSDYEKQLNKEEIEEYEKLFGKSTGKVIKERAAEFGKKLGAAFGESVEKYLGSYAQYMSKVNARIQGAGAGFDYESINRTLRRNTALNPFIKYTDVLDRLARLVDLGIADNLVQRAFLDTISDKIATTFDAAQGSLLEIIRIQQRDSTAARLGMEAELTQLFNHYFSDTSYLSETFDSVQASLIDLSAQLDERSSVELEYIIQKWLGSLGSVGVSSSTLSSIAQGLTYLGTGNVGALSGNQSLQNLLVMAANRANLSYSNILSGGLSAGDANLLLASLIQYVQEIAGSGNNVVRQQYAQLFGLTMADMRAFKNINDTVLNELYENGMTYADTLNELNSQMGQLGSRMHISEMVNNIIDNALADVGIGVASNPAMYGLWKAADMLESITGGISLPFISVLGSGTDLNMTLEGLMKGGVIGISAIGSLISGIANLGRGGGLGSFDALGTNYLWNVGLNKGGFSTYQSAGELSSRKSAINYVSSGNELGIQQSLADEQRRAGEEVMGETPDEDNPVYWIKLIWEFLESGNETNPLHVTVQNLDLYSSTIPAI